MKKEKKAREKVKLKLLWDAIRGSKRHLIPGLIGVVGVVATSFATPLVSGFTVDYVLKGETPDLPRFLARLLMQYPREFYLQRLWILALALVVITALCGLFIFIRNRSAAMVAEHTAQGMRERLYRHLNDLPYDYHKHATTGDLVQRCSSDVDTVRRFIQTQLMDIARASGCVIVALVIMLSINVRMALISTAVMPVLFLIALVYFSKVKKSFSATDEAEGRLSTFAQENLAGVRVVRAFGQQQSEVERFAKHNAEYRDAGYKMIKLIGYFWGVTDPIGYLQILATLIFGTLAVLDGTMTVGGVIIFVTYTAMLIWPVRQLGRVLSELGKSAVSLRRLQEIMDAPLEQEPGAALTPDIKGAIAFKDVYFGYDYPDEVLKGISFSVQPGQTVAILGSTGSGKSSLVHLLQRLYSCTGGAITIDGVNINDIERHHLRQHIGIVLQEPFLYSRSILENIRIVRPEATADEVNEASRVAAVHDVITEFEKGYDTLVGEKGVTLSGGQKQRVAIARMLLQQAPILIFDDSMSAVDTETDAAIRDALQSRKQGATTFIISHRITTLKEADFILVLEDGQVTQQGTHEELMAAPGFYSRIAGIQTLSAEEGDDASCK